MDLIWFIVKAYLGLLAFNIVIVLIRYKLSNDNTYDEDKDE